MARASFTLKRYLPINTEAAEASDWIVFNNRAGSGASTDSSTLVNGAPSFDLIVKATSPDWVVPTYDEGGILVNTGDTDFNDAPFFFYIYPEDQGSAAGGLGFDIIQNSQSGYTISEPVPFVDGQTYWIKYAFDGDNLTGSYFYAENQESEPTSWTSIPTETSTLSNLSSFTTLNSVNKMYIGLWNDNQSDLTNRFNGTIERVIVRTRTGITTEYFYYTGASDTWTVPVGVTSVEALLWGGGNASGQVYGQLSVTPGEVLTYRVGGKTTTSTGGWPNGGNGGTNTADSSYALGGGGSTDIKSGTTYLLIAGGRGGTSNPSETNYQHGSGADAGSGSTSTWTGTNGTPNGRPGYTTSYGGNGGTQTAAGTRGNPSSITSPVSVLATNGSGMQGGNGCTVNVAGAKAGGGGGGGYYGGGGGGTNPLTLGTYHGNGGGGSSYVDTSRVSNYAIARRIFPWYNVGDDPPNQTYDRIPRIITDTTNGTTATEVFGPPTIDWSTTDYDGLIVLRWVD